MVAHKAEVRREEAEEDEAACARVREEELEQEGTPEAGTSGEEKLDD